MTSQNQNFTDTSVPNSRKRRSKALPWGQSQSVVMPKPSDPPEYTAETGYGKVDKRPKPTLSYSINWPPLTSIVAPAM